MKPLAAILALTLAACSTKAPQAIPIAPTVPVPPKAKPVDLEPVRRDLGPVTEANRQLYEQIVTGKRSIYELNQKLKDLEKGRVATLEEWSRLTMLGEATANVLTESEKVNADQRKAIDALEHTVSLKSAEVAVADAQRAAVDQALEEANYRIVSLTQAQQDAAEAAKSANLRAASEKTRADTEAEWKWRFFGWACLTTISTALLTYLSVKPRFI